MQLRRSRAKLQQLVVQLTQHRNKVLLIRKKILGPHPLPAVGMAQMKNLPFN
jgi:hypothetical protein